MFALHISIWPNSYDNGYGQDENGNPIPFATVTEAGTKTRNYLLMPMALSVLQLRKMPG
jgi:hypothetical protein